MRPLSAARRLCVERLRGPVHVRRHQPLSAGKVQDPPGRLASRRPGALSHPRTIPEHHAAPVRGGGTAAGSVVAVLPSSLWRPTRAVEKRWCHPAGGSGCTAGRRLDATVSADGFGTRYVQSGCTSDSRARAGRSSSVMCSWMRRRGAALALVNRTYQRRRVSSIGVRLSVLPEFSVTARCVMNAGAGCAFSVVGRGARPRLGPACAGFCGRVAGRFDPRRRRRAATVSTGPCGRSQPPRVTSSGQKPFADPTSRADPLNLAARPTVSDASLHRRHLPHRFHPGRAPEPRPGRGASRGLPRLPHKRGHVFTVGVHGRCRPPASLPHPIIRPQRIYPPK